VTSKGEQVDEPNVQEELKRAQLEIASLKLHLEGATDRWHEQRKRAEDAERELLRCKYRLDAALYAMVLMQGSIRRSVEEREATDTLSLAV
jgi:hypothetical protein